MGETDESYFRLFHAGRCDIAWYIDGRGGTCACALLRLSQAKDKTSYCMGCCLRFHWNYTISSWKRWNGKCTIGNGPHLYQGWASAESLPDQEGNIGLALDVMANWLAEKA